MARSQVFSVALLIAGAAFGTGFVGLSSPAVRAPRASVVAVSARSSGEVPQAADAGEAISWSRYASAAFSMLAALVVAFAPVTEAQAARSGGRIGGSRPSMRSAPPSRPAPPAASKTTTNTTINHTTIVTPPPVIAPPMGMGMGMGFGAPVIVAPPPTLGEVVVGAAINGAINGAIINSVAGNRGPSTTDRIMENQMRQDERQMDAQANQIKDLEREIASMKAQQK